MKTPFKLYHLEYCPFCHKVRRAAERLGLELELVDIAADPTARARLLIKRGRATVPVLAIPEGEGERLVPESDDIVTFLEAYHDALHHADAA